jgi:NAD(P)-dependent dehydrogenase (short-subunit alcohol dehydrogenase family)
VSQGTVIVTGGTGGLGASVVDRLLEAGHELVVTWVDEDERDRTASAHADRPVRLRRLDVLDEEAFSALAADVDADGGLWGLVHLVGGYLDDAPLGPGSLADLDAQLALNLRSVAAGLGAVLPRLGERGAGRVVAVSARAALRPWAGASAYAASKAGVIALVQAAQQEVIGRGVCVNCILPSVIDTPANRSAQPDADHTRWVRPEEIGAVVAFLMSEQSSAVTGAAIPVYGRA